jgi:hypothetical protein
MNHSFIRGCIAAVLVASTSWLSSPARAGEKTNVLIFDGKGTDGWRQCGPGKFVLHDGVLTSEGGMGLFWHQADYSDFKLTLEFKVAHKGDNSGVFVRFSDPKDDPGIPIREGYEIQVCDTEEANPTGSIYGFQKSKEIATKPVGEWNKYEITVIGQKYTVKLNDKVVNEFTGNRSLHGHVGIQNHNQGSEVSYRNIRVVDLEKQAQKDKSAADKKAQKQDEPWARMQYGSFISATVQAPWPAENYANKGIALRLGEKQEAAVVFDEDLLRYSVGWTGDYLNWTNVAFNGSHGTALSIKGKEVFGTKPLAGVGTSTDLKDPRPQPYGPMPESHGKYKGLYRNGNDVVFKYSIDGAEVLEKPSIRNEGANVVFSRAIEAAPTKNPFVIRVADIPTKPAPSTQPSQADAAAAKMETPGVAIAGAPEGTKQEVVDGAILVTVPPHDQPALFEIAISPSESAKPQAVKPAKPLSEFCKGGPAQWTKPVETKGTLGTGDGAYVVDSVEIPFENPYNSWMRFGGFDFFSDGRVAVSTWNGDIWIVSGLDDKLEKITWKRFATGLFQPLGVKIVDDKIYVNCRDELMRLNDLNGDGEADFYEAYNCDVMVARSFHEFALDLQTDPEGNFYFAKAGAVNPGGRGWERVTPHNGIIAKISKDGQKFEVFATGVRAPNGMGVGPNGEITNSDNEGTWTPACRLNWVVKDEFLGVVDLAHRPTPPTDYDRPICWFPMNVDNSSGGQVWVTSDKWGPFKGEMLHTSYGKCSLFKVLIDRVDGQIQGGVARFPLEFESGIDRGRFSPIDHQLWVTGLRAWQTSAAKDACLQRVRYTGKKVYMPEQMHLVDGGIAITFTQPLDQKTAIDIDNWNVEQWNYKWSNAYGSDEYSVADPTKKEHDPVDVKSIAISSDLKTVTLKIDDLKPVMQMKIEYNIKAQDGTKLESFITNTINKVPGQGKVAKTGSATQAAAK